MFVVFVTIIIIIIILSLFSLYKYNKNTYFSKIYIKESNIPGAGLGVFASKNISKGETIEIAPCIEDKNYSKEYNIRKYAFTSKNSGKSLIAFGYASMYNHSDNYNAYFDYHGDRSIIFKAYKNIKKGEEILVSYGKTWGYYNWKK
jgi:SET domain-containing protein